VVYVDRGPPFTHRSFVRTFHVVHDVRAADIVSGLPWLDDEHATLKFGAERLFTLFTKGIVIENQVIEIRPECALLSSTKVQKLMWKSSRAKGRIT
jgi:hypothetical protein